MRMGRLPAIAVATLGLVGACSGDSGGGPGSSTSSTTAGLGDATTVTEPVAAGTATLTLAGDAGLDGGLSNPTVTCSFPELEGLRIAVLATNADGNLTYRVSISADGVL